MNYRQFLPEPPDDCGDPELFRLLNEFQFVRRHPDLAARCDELKHELAQPAIWQRAEAATSDPCAELRLYAGHLLCWVQHPAAPQSALALLADPTEHVRGGIAVLLGRVKDSRFAQPLIALAKHDPSSYIRGCAASGLRGQDPALVIPVLLQIIDEDLEPCETGHTPSQLAASALDDLLESEWTARRQEGSLRSLRPGGQRIDLLKQQAMEYLARLQRAD